MRPTVTLTFSGVPEPEPGPIPAASAELLRARDHGEIGFADAPRDRTQVPEIEAAAARIREVAAELIVAGDPIAVKTILALLAAAGGPDDFPVRERAETDAPAWLFAVKDPGESAAWEEYVAVRDRLAAPSGAEAGSAWRDRVAIVSDPAHGPFFAEAARAGVAHFAWPVAIPAEECFLTVVGLLPAACAGLDVTTVLDDAGAAQERADGPDFTSDPARRLAAALAAADGWAPSTAGRPGLEPLAEWLDGRLGHHSGTGPSAGGLTIHLEPAGRPGTGAVIAGGAPGALVQTLLTAVSLFGIARRRDA